MNSLKATISDWASAPGLTISQLISRQGIEPKEFSKIIGVDFGDVNRLLNGQMAIDSLIAQELSSNLGGSVAFWLKREADYREALEKKKQISPGNWIKQFPIKEMRSWGWLNNSDDEFTSLLEFFDIDSPRAWFSKYVHQIGEFAFRKVDGPAKAGHITAWLRRAELMATTINCEKWNADHFRAVLTLCKPISYERNPAVFIPALQNLCSRAGVAVVAVRSPAGTGVSGATKFMSSEKAMLCLSFRHLTDDHLWFTFFHEAGHLLLHKKSATFLDTDDTQLSQQEREANAFAQKTLIPTQYRAQLIAAKNSKYEIARLARKLEVSPGILVGQLQKEGLIPYNRMNHMKRRYHWSSLES